MPLQLIVESLDSVPEALRGEYTEKDGKFHLNVDGLEDTKGLKSALEKEREARRTYEKQVKKWESLGKSDEEIAELLRKHAEDETNALKKKGDFDAILKQKQEAWEKEKADLIAERDASRSSERSAVVGERLVAALARGGVTEEGAELLPERLSNRIKFETVDGKRVLKILQADGETPMAGSGADGSATLDDLVKEAVKKYPSLFKGEGRGGSGKRPDLPGGGSSVNKKSDFKSEKERAAYVEKHGIEAYNALPDK